MIGFGRFGQLATQMLLADGVDVTVIDKDVDRIKAAGRFGFKVYYGDGCRLDVLRAGGAGTARVIAVCVDDRAAALAPSWSWRGSTSRSRRSTPAPMTASMRST